MGGWGKPPAPKGQRGLLAKKKAAAAAGGVVRRPLKAKNPPADLLWRQPSVKPDAGADESPRTQRARACKLEAARAVGWREQCLMSLNTLVLNWPPVPKKAMNRQDDHRAAEAVRWLKNQSLELRDAGLNCVEKVRVCGVGRGAVGGAGWKWLLGRAQSSKEQQSTHASLPLLCVCPPCRSSRGSSRCRTYGGSPSPFCGTAPTTC